MTAPMHPKYYFRRLKVFLCHSKEDREKVRDLYVRLQAHDIEPWLDEENLVAGQDWHDEIRRVIRDVDVVVVCLTQASITKKGFVQAEIKIALDEADKQPEDTIFIIPLKLEECTVPRRLEGWQWVALYEDQGYARLVKALKERARKLQGVLTVHENINLSGTAQIPQLPDISNRAQLQPQLQPPKRKRSLIQVSELITLSCHSLAVNALVFNRLGNILMSASGDGSVGIWEIGPSGLPTGNQELFKLSVSPNSYVYSLCLNTDNSLLGTGSNDGKIRIWEIGPTGVPTGRATYVIEAFNNRLWTIAFHKDKSVIVSTDDENAIVFWNMDTNTPISRFIGHRDVVWDLCFNSDGTLMLTGSGDKTIKLWQVDPPRELHTFVGHNGQVNNVKFSPDGSLVISSSWDGTVKIWGLASGREIQTFSISSKRITSIALKPPEGRILATGGQDSIIKLWDIKTGRELKSISFSNTDITSLAFRSIEGDILVAGTDIQKHTSQQEYQGGLIRFWQIDL